MEFPCLLSRIFKPKDEKYFTLQDRGKYQTFSKPTEQGYYSQIFESDSVINYITKVLAKMASPSTENDSLRRFW